VLNQFIPYNAVGNGQDCWIRPLLQGGEERRDKCSFFPYFLSIQKRWKEEKGSRTYAPEKRRGKLIPSPHRLKREKKCKVGWVCSKDRSRLSWKGQHPLLSVTRVSWRDGEIDDDVTYLF